MPNWLTCSLVVLLVALNGLQLWLSREERAKWMRMFCETRSIPIPSMEGAREPVREPTPPKPPARRFTVPVPLGWRPPERAHMPSSKES